MDQKYRKRSLLLLCLSSLLMMVSCDKFDGDQTVPAYLRIPSFSLTTTELQGTASHKITDAWVYVDNELIGAYELPANLPVLARGNHSVRVQAGIKLNGIASTRIYYPFYKPLTYSLNLKEDSTITLSPATTYYDNVNFKLMENFENGGSSLEKTEDSDTTLRLTSEDAFEGDYSGVAYLNDSVTVFECATVNEYSLPKAGASVFLEMNYKTNNEVVVGLYGISLNQVIQKPCLVLNHTTGWNKIYINLTPAISDLTTSVTFKVFIGAVKESGVDHPVILIDNLKLLHF